MLYFDQIFQHMYVLFSHRTISAIWQKKKNSAFPTAPISYCRLKTLHLRSFTKNRNFPFCPIWNFGHKNTYSSFSFLTFCFKIAVCLHMWKISLMISSLAPFKEEYIIYKIVFVYVRSVK